MKKLKCIFCGKGTDCRTGFTLFIKSKIADKFPITSFKICPNCRDDKHTIRDLYINLIKIQMKK